MAENDTLSRSAILELAPSFIHGLTFDPMGSYLQKFKIIDLFAGPGGLGEGFSRFEQAKEKPFQIAVSIEKEKFAHATLELRSFFRKFENPPEDYYCYIRNEITREELFGRFVHEAELAREEAWQAELGNPEFPSAQVFGRISEQLEKTPGTETIVIGGPPCQAYSLAGRSKMRNDDGFAQDPRHTLYKEYLNIIAEFQPAVFVMENVKGILSSKLNGEPIFRKILDDLSNPQLANSTNFDDICRQEVDQYKIYSLSCDGDLSALKSTDFTIRAEEYGIPQARHRVILIGIRSDINIKPKILRKAIKMTSVEDVIGDLPKLRSGLSKGIDTYGEWVKAIQAEFSNANLSGNLGRGEEFMRCAVSPKSFSDWYTDHRIGGIINHCSRSHIAGDLHRYYFCAGYAQNCGVSPRLADMPENLLPNHKNVGRSILNGSLFSDRFKVQIGTKPASTITSHISKDGHYFIHYDQTQCRSLTVREAARIQTFPDNYYFEGPRTAQYQQVGNAVPPKLAIQIAKLVYDVLERDCSDS